MPDKMTSGDRNCGNCQHMTWLVALGLGVRCTHPDNRNKILYEKYPEPRHELPLLPASLDFVCEHFRRKRTH